jgi:hypothetical protein
VVIVLAISARGDVLSSRFVAPLPASLHERFDIAYCLLAVVKRHVVDGGGGGVETEFSRDPVQRLGARRKGIDCIAANLSCDQWFQRIVQLAFGFTQCSVSKPAERHIACAARVDANPRLTCRAYPDGAVIFPIGVRFIPCTGERGVLAAVTADGLRERLHRSTYAHTLFRQVATLKSYTIFWSFPENRL